MQKLRSAIPYVAVFFCIVISLLLIKYPIQKFSDSADPYYHVSHASAYLHHSQITYPQLTYLSLYPSDLWLGYHLILSAAYLGTDKDDYAALVTRTIIVHIILSALLITAIACLCVAYFQAMRPFYARQLQSQRIFFSQPILSKSALIMISLGAMFFFSPAFMFRALFMERPHVLMILLVVIGLYYLIRRKYFPLTILAILAPLCYSLSLFIFIPAAIPFIGWLIINRNKKELPLIAKPFLYTAIGYIVGLLLHPDTWGYLLNGVLLALYAIFKSLLWWAPAQTTMIIPAEMVSGDITTTIGLLVPVLMLIGLMWYRIQESRKTPATLPDSAYTKDTAILEAGFCGLALFLGLGSLLITRAVEYSVPILFIASITFLLCYLIPFARYIHQQLLSNPDEIVSFYKQAVVIVQKVAAKRFSKVALYWVFIVILSIFLFQSYQLANSHTYEADRLEGAIHFLSTQDNRNLIVLNEFSMYTQGVFYGPANRYATGMDPRMTYFFNPDAAKILDVFLYGQVVCGTSCTQYDGATILHLLQQIGATHLLVDLKNNEEDSYVHLINRPFLELQYQDEQYPEVRVYSIVTE